MINKYKVNYSITSEDGIIYGEVIMKSNTKPSHFEALNYLNNHSRELAIPGDGTVSGLTVVSVQLI
ncbi:MAG: hypothetical protein ACRCWB_01015 [Enterovibrio sp.]